MKFNMHHIILVVSISILSSCTTDIYNNEDSSIRENGIPVSFHLPSSKNSSDNSTIILKDQYPVCSNQSLNIKSQELVLTKNSSTSPIPIGSTIRVIAYRRKNQLPDPAVDLLVASQSYRLNSNNTLIPVSVNQSGDIITGKASDMYLTSGNYDFYAYSPAIPLLNDSSVVIPQGINFITSELLDNSVRGTSNSITLPNFQRKMAQIEFYIQPDPDVPEITSISSANAGISLILPGEAFIVHNIGNQELKAEITSSYLIPQDSCKQINATKLKCTSCIFPISNKEVGIELNLKINNKEKIYTVLIDSVTFKAGNKYIYQINLELSDLDIHPIANCYMIEPGSSIIFPVNQITATGHFNLKYQIWNASVYWETSPGLINIEEEDQNNDLLKVGTSKEGNGLIVITPKNSSTILWSWHIWSTGYVPDKGLNSHVTSSVPGGRVIRLNSKPFIGNSKVMMDRNLGALSTTESINSWGMYYQWGRKDPFPPEGIAIYGKKIKYYLAYLSDYYTSIENPTTFYFGYFNWLLGGNRYLWTDTQKSIFDPCPPGWKVAASDMYNVNMSNTINWIKNPGIYSDGAIYKPQMVWYPAQGGIGYFSGDYTQMGQYAYIWSSTYDFFDSSYALTITNRFNTSANDMYRANGLPVRCVQTQSE